MGLSILNQLAWFKNIEILVSQCVSSSLNNVTISEGPDMKDDAKIIGITPPMFNFKGRTFLLAPSIKILPLPELVIWMRFSALLSIITYMNTKIDTIAIVAIKIIFFQTTSSFDVEV